MSTFETEIKKMINNLQKYSLIEFYHEEIDLKQKIQKMGEGLSNFSLYLPKARVICKDLVNAQR